MGWIIGKERGMGSVLVVVTGLAVSTAAPARADKTYEFSFTAKDVMSYILTPGADGSTAADNSVFDGARLRRDGGGSPAMRSYWTSQSGAFNTWAQSTNDKLLSFNLWGLDGRGSYWGEDYKPKDWGTYSGPAGWTNSLSTWTGNGWGAPPIGYSTEEIIGWDANSFTDGLNFQDSALASKVFTFRVTFDDVDKLWGGSTNGAPNDFSQPKLTFWFGGWMDNDLWGTDNSYYIYEGNMVLTGHQVPAPGATLLLVTGLGLVGWIKRRAA